MSEGVHKVQGCGQCNELFEDPERLVRHLLKHEGKKPFPCDQCEASCTTLSNLQRHKRAAHNNTDCKEPNKNADDDHINLKEANAEFDPFTLKTEQKTETKSDIKLEFLLLSNPLRL